MSDESPQMGVGRFALKATNTVIGVAAVVACLTVLFYCMRAVMEIGGSCASGGPYEIARPCPKGVGWMTPVSIFVGLAALGWMIAWNHGLSGPKWALLAWPALFLTLGYNFWDYGLDAPGEQGAVAGWIVCGVLFGLMGGLPLLALKSRTLRRVTFWSRRVRYRRGTDCRQTDGANPDRRSEADLPTTFDAVVTTAAVHSTTTPAGITRAGRGRRVDRVGRRTATVGGDAPRRRAHRRRVRDRQAAPAEGDMIRLNSAGVKSLMLVLHLLAIPAGIAAGMWLFESLT